MSKMTRSSDLSTYHFELVSGSSSFQIQCDFFARGSSNTSLSESVWLPSLIMCYQSLESFRSPEVFHFIHKKHASSFSDVVESLWVSDHIIMSGTLQAKSLGWFPCRIRSAQFPIYFNAAGASQCPPRLLLLLHLYSVDGASSYVILLHCSTQRFA